MSQVIQVAIMKILHIKMFSITEEMDQGETFLSILKNIGMSDEEKENSNTLINHTETVKVVYDSSKVSTETLIKNFLGDS